MLKNENPPEPETPQSEPQLLSKSSLFNTLNRVLAIAGVLSMVAGVIYLLLLWMKPSAAPQTALFDGLFNAGMGAMLLICSRLLSKGRVLVIWVFGAVILISVIYSYAMGRGINYIITLAGAVVIWQMFNLKKGNEIS